MDSKVKFSGPMTIALGIAGLCLCFVSVYYTVDLLRSLGTNKHEQWLMTITAIGFEACKFAFIPIALAMCGYGKAIRGSAILVLGIALVGVSMVASLGFLAAKTDQGIEMARTESDEYKAGQTQLKTIDQNIAMLSSAAAIDAASQWRQARENASQKIIQIKTLDQERSRIVESMKTIDATSKTDTGALFIALSRGWHMTAEDTKKLCYIVVALLLELCSIAALYLAGVGALKTANQDPSPEKMPLPTPKRSLTHRFSNWLPKSTASMKNASHNVSAASTRAPVASVEAALKDESMTREAVLSQERPGTSTSKAQRAIAQKHFKSEAVPPIPNKAPTQVSAPVYDLTEYSAERKRVEQDRQCAHQAKMDALEAQSALARETKAISTEAARLREDIADQAAVLKQIAGQQISSVGTTIKKPPQKRSSKAPIRAKSAFDQALFKRMQHEVTDGQVKGSIRSLQAAYNLGFTKAKMYHDKLKQLEIVQSVSPSFQASQA